MNRLLAAKLIAKHEGLRLKPYKDGVGKLTIGYGRNLDEAGITRDEAEALLQNDVERIDCILQRVIPQYQFMPTNRQIALVDMAFNVGVNGLLGFHVMLKALDNRDFSAAAAAMKASKWALQVGSRAVELATLMEIG